MTNIEMLSSVRCLGSWTLSASAFSAFGPKDTVDGPAQGKSPCEDDISKGLADGGEGQTGSVESEVVLKCEGNNNEGARVPAVLYVKNDCFERHYES